MALAPVKISELTAATTPLDGTEEIPLNQGGVTKRVTAQDVADLTDLSGYSPTSHRHLNETITPVGITLQTPVSAPTDPYTFFLNIDERTVSLLLDDGGSLELGKEMFDHYTVLEAGGIVNGDIVSVVGASGNRSAVALTDVNNAQKSLATIGMCTVTSIANNNVGRITTKGHVHELDTSGYTEGMPIYVSTANPGKWQQNPPDDGSRIIQIGIVVVTHATQGVVDVDVKVYQFHNEMTGLNVGDYKHLTESEYEWVYGQQLENARLITGTDFAPLTRTTDTGNPPGIPDYKCCLFYNQTDTPWFDGFVYDTTRVITIDAAGFLPQDTVKVLIYAGQINILRNKDENPFWNVVQKPDFADTTAFYEYVAINSSEIFWAYVGGDGGNDSFFSMGIVAENTPDYFELHVRPNGNFEVSSQNFLNWMTGQLAWSKIDKTGAVASDVNAVPQSYCTTNNVPSGFIDHTTSTVTLVENVGAVNDTFDVTITGTDFPVYINGTLRTKNTETITQVGAVSKRYFIYYDGATQALSISDTAWNLESEDYDGAAPICTVLWDAINHQGIIEEERHHSWRDIHWHHWAHHTVGPQYSAAHYADAFTLTYGGASPDLTFSMSQGSLYDEDVRNDTAGVVTICNLFYHHSDGTMLWEKDSPQLYKAVAGVPQYDNGTGLGAKTANNSTGHFVSWVYGTNGSNDGTLTKRDIAVVVGQDTNATMTLAEAQAAALPTLPNYFVIEWKLLYKVIFLYAAGGAISRISTTDYRIAGSIPSGQSPTSNVSAGSVSFAPTGNIAATNVQSAIEELDTEKINIVGNGVQLNTATGDQVAYTLDYTVNKATSGNDTGLLIKMTDTASPGTSYPFQIMAGASGTTNIFNINNSGVLTAVGVVASANPVQCTWVNPSTTGAILYGATITNTGSQTICRIAPTYNQTSGTASNTDLLINRTQTAVGSGAQLLIDAQVTGVSKFRVDNTGFITALGISCSAAVREITSGDITIATTDNGYVVTYTGSSGVNIVLPAVSGFSSNFQVQIINMASAAVDLTVTSEVGEYKGAGTKISQYKSAYGIVRNSKWWFSGGLS